MTGVQVHPIRLAELALPDFHPQAPGADTVYGFLVRDGEACVLVDTGVGAGSELIERLYRPRRVELADALAGVGASPGDVTAVVNTHLHFDHCGNNHVFPGVPVFVQEAELEAARQPGYTVPEWVEFAGARYVTVRGDHAISEHLELRATPGHTPGHQSLVVRRGDRVELIVGQAAYSAAEFRLFCERRTASARALERCVESNATGSAEAYLASLDALDRIGPERAFFSHDATVWERAEGPVEVRSADDRFSDWTGLLDLLRDAFAYMEGRIDPPSSVLRLTPESLAAKAGDEQLLLATDGRAVIGCVFACPRGESLYLSKLAVRRDRRRHGIARALVRAVESLARERGHTALELETRIELTENHATFGALGFVRTSEHTHEGFDRPTYVRMRKPLEPA